MKWAVFALLVCLCGLRTSKAQEQLTLLPAAPKPQPGIMGRNCNRRKRGHCSRRYRRSRGPCPQSSAHGRAKRQRLL
jgi:hypothetical protein